MPQAAKICFKPHEQNIFYQLFSKFDFCISLNIGSKSLVVYHDNYTKNRNYFSFLKFFFLTTGFKTHRSTKVILQAPYKNLLHLLLI